jgi:hypothetical protein
MGGIVLPLPQYGLVKQTDNFFTFTFVRQNLRNRNIKILTNCGKVRALGNDSSK